MLLSVSPLSCFFLLAAACYRLALICTYAYSLLQASQAHFRSKFNHFEQQARFLHLMQALCKALLLALSLAKGPGASKHALFCVLCAPGQQLSLPKLHNLTGSSSAGGRCAPTWSLTQRRLAHEHQSYVCSRPATATTPPAKSQLAWSKQEESGMRITVGRKKNLKQKMEI